MKFKEPELEAQLNTLPSKLQEIAIHFDDICQQLGRDAVVTRVWDPVPGDSGVHEAHRGIDFRDQTEEGSLFTPEEVNQITVTLNNFYPRTDGKLVCIHHSFQGGMMHFHVQIPLSWA